MPITVLSPFNGKQVKVRDQDAGRAVKDDEGRLFYVLPKSDGSGYYGATTRAGNPKEETRALEMESKSAVGQGKAKDQVEVSLKGIPSKRGSGGKFVLLFVVGIVVAIIWVFFWGPLMQYNPMAKLLNSHAQTAP